ncbi:MAG: hypothetical protein IPJ00_09190 [Saprospirales bacterium]|nr:hypothetical protein [Saprospirales bacterium]
MAQEAADWLDNLKKAMGANGLFRLFSLKYDFPNTFNQVLNVNYVFAEINIGDEHFPYFILPSANLKVAELKVLVISETNFTIDLEANDDTLDSFGTTWKKQSN